MPETIGLPFTLDPLDKNLVMPKPQNSITDKKIEKLEQEGKLIKTRKRDGYGVLIAITTNGIKIYTRGIDDITARFPHIVEQLQREIAKFPLPALINGEMIVDRDGKDDYESLVKIVKLSPQESVRYQQQNGYATFMAFGPVVWGGQLMTTATHAVRLRLIDATFGNLLNAPNLIPLEILDCSFQKAWKLVMKNKWEGLVLYDSTKPSTYALDGNIAHPPRPDGAWKRKPVFEDDFIVRTWNHGNGRNAKWMGELCISQIDPATNKEVPYGVVGLGFTDVMREEFVHANYPLVVEVQFQKRFRSGALFAAKHLRTREDKKPEECIRKT